MKFWKQLDRKTIYLSDWIEITLDKLELPDGRIIENFELMHYPHSTVGVVAVNEKGGILLVRAYRYLHESFDWEVPGGVCETDEHHVDAVRRELMEETGYSCEIVSPLLRFYPHKATCDEEYYVFCAEGLKQESGEFQKTEIKEIGWFTTDQVMAMIESDEINDSLSIVALQHYIIHKTQKA